MYLHINFQIDSKYDRYNHDSCISLALMKLQNILYNIYDMNIKVSQIHTYLVQITS